MATPRILAATLALLLLLSTTAGTVAHEHGAEAAHAAELDCTVDHARGDAYAGDAYAGGAAALLAGGERHRHRCVGCYLGGHRTLEADPGAAAPLLVPSAGEVRPRPPAPRVFVSHADRTLRGPPRA